MQNNEAKKLNKSISETILSQEFDEVRVPLVKTRLYKADEVDQFLTRQSREVEQLEKASQRLLQFYENNKNGRVAESNSGPLEEKANVDEPEMMQVLKSKDQRMDRLQKHMAVMFEEAEKRSEAIIADAELEKVEIIQQSNAEAERIIAEAQRIADEIKKTAEDKIKEAKLVKYELDQKAQDVQNQIILRAQQLDDMQGSFSEMSQKLRGLVQGASA